MKDEYDTATAELAVQAEAPETSRPEGLTLVQMKDIEVKHQIRTESGWSDAEIDELGESIMKEGLLQLPLLRRDAETAKLIPVAGHRRIESMKRKGFSEFFAIVGDADESKAFRMQLAENIQREQLSMREIANAVRKLADEGNTPAQIGDIVKKSKAWVSKHLSLTHANFGKYARDLFVTGVCEDLEILGSLSQAEKAADAAGYNGNLWTRERIMRAGKLTRATAADAAKKAKALKPAGNEEEGEGEEESQKEGDNTSSNEMPDASAMLDSIEERMSEERWSYADAFDYLMCEFFKRNENVKMKVAALRDRFDDAHNA